VAAALGHRLPVLDPPGRQEPGRRVATPTAPAGTTGRSALTRPPARVFDGGGDRDEKPAAAARTAPTISPRSGRPWRPSGTSPPRISTRSRGPTWSISTGAGAPEHDSSRRHGPPVRRRGRPPRPGTAGGPWASGTTGWAVEGPSSEQGWPRARRLVGRSGGGDGRGARPVGRV